MSGGGCQVPNTDGDRAPHHRSGGGWLFHSATLRVPMNTFTVNMNSANGFYRVKVE